MSYIDYLPEDGKFSEEELWEAIAESIGVDANEIMDGDLVEFLETAGPGALSTGYSHLTLRSKIPQKFLLPNRYNSKSDI